MIKNNIQLVIILLLIILIICVVLHSYNRNEVEGFTNEVEFTSEQLNEIINLLIQQNNNLDEIIVSMREQKSIEIPDEKMVSDLNKNISNLIDDVYNNKYDYIFNSKQDMQDYRLNLIDEGINKSIDKMNIDNLEKEDNNKVKMISNPSSGLNLNIHRVKYDKESNLYPNNDNRYVVYVNGKCLSYDENTKYGLEQCMANKTEQQFNIRNIKTLDDYNNTIKDKKYTLQNESSIPLPFHILSPVNNNQDCLNIDVNDLSIEECNLGPYQRWNTSTKMGSC